MRKIGFFINKYNCYVYGIDSHVATSNEPTLIIRNGDEYHFKGKGRVSNFYYDKSSITPVGNFIKTPIPQHDLEKELLLALKRDGYKEVFVIDNLQGKDI